MLTILFQRSGKEIRRPTQGVVPSVNPLQKKMGDLLGVFGVHRLDDAVAIDGVNPQTKLVLQRAVR